VWGNDLHDNCSDQELEAIQEFVAKRPRSLCYKFAYPGGTGRAALPGQPPSWAVSTRLAVTKALHSAPWSRNSWITAELQYLDAAGRHRWTWGRCHLYDNGEETRAPLNTAGVYIPTDMAVSIHISLNFLD